MKQPGRIQGAAQVLLKQQGTLDTAPNRIDGRSIIESIVIRQTATYQEIRKWVREHHGFEPKTCWIAHCKELHGLPLGPAPNRQAEERVEPCPPAKIAAITQAFRHFGMLP